MKMKSKAAVKMIDDDDNIGSINIDDSIGGGNDNIKIIDDRNSDGIGIISNDDNNYYLLKIFQLHSMGRQWISSFKSRRPIIDDDTVHGIENNNFNIAEHSETKTYPMR